MSGSRNSSSSSSGCSELMGAVNTGTHDPPASVFRTALCGQHSTPQRRACRCLFVCRTERTELTLTLDYVNKYVPASDVTPTGNGNRYRHVMRMPFCRRHKRGLHWTYGTFPPYYAPAPVGEAGALGGHRHPSSVRPSV